MRNLCLALVLANLAFAAWTAWHAEPPPPATSARATGLPIRLVGEAEGGDDGAPAATGSTAAVEDAGGAAERDDAADTDGSALVVVPSVDGDAAFAAADAGGSPSVAAAADRCVSVGPFAEAARAEAAAAALESAGYAPAQRTAEGEIWVGFWVHIAAIPSRAEANDMLARLRDNGLPDAYLIPGEEDGDIISLGVFNDMTRAGRLEEQVRRIGLVPVTVERSRQGVVQWLDVSVPAEAGRTLDLGALGIRQERIEQRPCPASG